MALPLLSPAINKTRQAISQNSQRAILRLVPELERGERVTNRSFAILVTIGLLAISLSMFVISALSTQDAFTLAKLQRQAQTLSDQKDAVNREIAFKSSASALAADARKLGMGPDGQPRFIEISGASHG